MKLLELNSRRVEIMQPRSQGFRMRTRWETRKPWSGPVNFAFWLANTILSKNNWTWQLTITIQVICIFMILMCTSMFCKIIFQSKTFSRLHDLLSPRPVTKLKSRVDVSWDVSLTKREFETSTIIQAVVFLVQYNSIYNVVQMSDEILRVLHCSNILIYNILYWQIKARQTIKWN
jgi:hypothetical protein